MPEGYDRQEFFETYFAKASEKPLFIESFSKHFETQADSLSILDLGCHDGTLMLRLLDKIKTHLPAEVRVVGVDPSEPSVRKFETKQLPDGVSLECHTLTGEDFLSRDERQFTWIIASHCLYWTEDLERTLRSISERSDNAVVVFRGSRGIFEIQSQFKDLLGNPNEKLYTADDISRSFDVLGIQYSKEIHQTSIEIPKPDSQEFRWIVSFFLQTSEERINSEEWTRIETFLEPYGGEFRHDVTFFWLKK